jgi:hypothetical protein
MGIMTRVAALALALPPQEPRVVTPADFERLPMIEVPAAALEALIPEGSATVECAVENGLIANCTVVEESPQGFHFGTEVLRSLRRATLKPEVAAQTERFRLTVRFSIEVPEAAE